jgi:type I restriction enzyme R subunit
VQAAVQAWRYREALARLEFAPVISGSNNDDPAWKAWTDGAAHEQLITRFKKPLFHADPAKADPLAFLVVKSMLLTGFDAPIEGVMYLDRPIREAELLQAIARVNRSGFGKRCGIVVDYYGVAQHLKEALAAYADEEVEGALASLKDEVPVLRDRHLRVVDLFRQRGIESLEDTEACVEALATKSCGPSSPSSSRPSWRRWTRCCRARRAAVFGRRQAAGLHLRPGPQPLQGHPGAGQGRRRQGAQADRRPCDLAGHRPKIPPIQLTDAEFDTQLARAANDRAKASEMEHAIRSHIRKHADEDPVLYRKLSER